MLRKQPGTLIDIVIYGVRKSLKVVILASLFLLSQQAVFSKKSSCFNSVDFRNFSYPEASESWQQNQPDEANFDLINGVYHFPDEPNPLIGIFFEKVIYNDVTHDGADEAIVVLGMHNSGSSGYYKMVYVFECKDDRPLLICSAEYERAYKVKVRNHQIVVTAPLWTEDDPHCCPTYKASYHILFDKNSSPQFFHELTKKLTQLKQIGISK